MEKAEDPSWKDANLGLLDSKGVATETTGTSVRVRQVSERSQTSIVGRFETDTVELPGAFIYPFLCFLMPPSTSLDPDADLPHTANLQFYMHRISNADRT